MQRTPRQCRAEILWAGAGFLLVQAVLGFCVDRFWTDVRDPLDVAKRSRVADRLAESPGRPLVVVLGSSRAGVGIDGATLSRASSDGPVVFNHAFSGGGPMLSGVCLKRLLADGIRPDMVVVDIVLAQLADNRGRVLEENGLDATRLSFMELSEVLPRYNRTFSPVTRWTFSRALPIHFRQAELNRRLALDVPREGQPDPLAGMDAHGWVPGPPHPQSQREASARQHLASYGRILAGARLGEGATSALSSLLRDCREHGIAAAVLLMPEATPFRELYPPTFLAEATSFLNRLCAEHDAVLIDARDWAEDGDFNDTHHLHYEGVPAFTNRFAREGLEVLRRRLPSRPASQEAR